MKVSEIQALLRTARQSVDGVEGVAKSVFDGFDTAIDQLETFAGVDISRAAEAIAQAGDAPQLAKQLSALTAERDAIAAQLTDSTTLALNTSRELAAVRQLGAAGIRPDYEDLLLPKVAGALQVGDDGTVTVPEGLIDGLKTQYAAMFHAADAAGTGGDLGDGQTSGGAAQATQVSVGDGGVVSGVSPDDLLSGKVTLV
jgi:hypothetical protein